MNEYDVSTEFLGHWGCFQKMIFFLLCITAIPNGTGILSIPFVIAIPSHHCVIPQGNLTQDWLDVIIPMKVNHFTTMLWWVKFSKLCFFMV